MRFIFSFSRNTQTFTALTDALLNRFKIKKAINPTGYICNANTCKTWQRQSAEPVSI